MQCLAPKMEAKTKKNTFVFDHFFALDGRWSQFVVFRQFLMIPDPHNAKNYKNTHPKRTERAP